MSIDTPKTCPTMVSIQTLSDYKFEIPVYQRGFRWTRQQIKELIDDLYEFSKDASKSTYCLQNVTVRKKVNDAGENIYEVIDGQQRLTVIWLLVMSYMDSKKYDDESMPVYTLEYEEKDGLTEYVASISDKVRENPSCVDIVNIDHPKDIDSSFIFNAFEFIINSYKSGGNKYSTVLNAIFNDEFFSGKKQISIIWNEIDPVGVDDSEKTKYIIDRFSNLNANKIPLTESELIKAYFIDSLSSDRAQEFSLQWEEMERGLNNEEFWWFISSGQDEETRTDILFRVHLNAAESIDANGQHNLSRLISQKLSDAESAYNEWSQIVQIYDTLNDWYKDYYYYHVIGLIIAIEKESASSIIKSLYDAYNHSSKKEFKELLKRRIRNENCFRTPFLVEGDDWNIEQASEILLEGRDDKEISYIRNKALVKPILLLFNVSLLLNAYSINSENAAERFSFKIYKSRNNPIEIEHINPQHLEGKKLDGSEYTADEKKSWALSTIEVIEDAEIKSTLEDEINAANWNNQNKTLIERIESAAQLNALSNLTLLDKNLNIRYGDNFFKEKRNHILAARFGNPVPYGDSSSYYEQSVIFPGTMWVFMRQYNGIIENDRDRWDANDRQEYINCIQKSIFRFLEPVKNETKRETDGE